MRGNVLVRKRNDSDRGGNDPAGRGNAPDRRGNASAGEGHASAAGGNGPDGERNGSVRKRNASAAEGAVSVRQGEVCAGQRDVCAPRGEVSAPGGNRLQPAEPPESIKARPRFAPPPVSSINPVSQPSRKRQPGRRVPDHQPKGVRDDDQQTTPHCGAVDASRARDEVVEQASHNKEIGQAEESQRAHPLDHRIAPVASLLA